MLAALDACGCHPRPRGDHVDAQCPVPDHPDRKPSLSVDWRPELRKGGSGIVLNCHLGCAPDDVVAAMGLEWADLYDEPLRPRDRAAYQPRPRRRPARPTPKPPAKKGNRSSKEPADPRDDPRTWPAVARYGYVDEVGEVLGEVLRLEHPERDHANKNDNRKTFRWRRLNEVGRWVWGAPDRKPLYRLPQVLAAIAAGNPVYVVEGEKDADRLADELGVCATCNPGGVTRVRADGTLADKWLPEHTEALRGAHVVLVPDRDQATKQHAGYRHAAIVARELEPVAASVRAAEAATGKDVSDHLDAGHSLDELRPLTLDELASYLPAEAPAEVGERQTNDATDGKVIDGPWDHDRGRGGDDGEPPLEVTEIERDHFQVVGDSLVKIPAVKPRRDGKPGKRRAVEVLNTRVRLVRRVRRDLGDGDRVQVSHVDLEAARGTETAQLTGIEYDDFERLTWAADLPWPDVTYKRTHQGRSDVVNAIAATSTEVETVTAYGTLGWREVESGHWVYVHGAGAIDSGGAAPGVRVDVDSELNCYGLPEPPDLGDSQQIGEAFAASLALLEDLPPRIGAVLLGAAMRAILGETGVTVNLVGLKGAGKSSLASLIMQHYAPTARYDTPPFGAGEDAATLGGLEEVRFTAGHCVLWADDIAPDDGPEKAITRASKLARSQYNRTGRLRMRQKGGLRPTHKPRGLLVLTAEEGARGSAESRTVYVPLEVGELDPATLARLGTPMAHDRALFTSAYARWLAARMPVRPAVEKIRAELSLALRDPDAEDIGIDARRADLIADLATGIRMALEMALDVGAIAPDAARTYWATAWAGLTESKRQQGALSESRALPARAADLLRTAILRGQANLRARTGGCPDMVSDLSACGWEAPSSRVTSMDHTLVLEARAMGDCVGWTDGERVWLDKGAAYATMDAQGRQEREPLGVSKRALARALVDAGLRTREQQTQRHYDAVVTLEGRQRTVWELPWEWLYPEPPGDSGTNHLPPAPPLPGADPTDEPDVPQDVPHGRETSARSDETSDKTSGRRPSSSRTSPEGDTACSTRAKTAKGPDSGRDSTRSGQSQNASRKEPKVVRPAAAVLDVDEAWLTAPDLLEPTETPELTSLQTVTAWATDLGLGFDHDYARPDDGQVWIMPELAERLGFPPTPPENKPRPLAELEAAGWTVRHHQAWITAWRPGARTVRVVIVPWLDRDDCKLLDGDPGALDVAGRLGMYAEHLGLMWRVSGGVTGVDLMDILRPPKSRLGVPEPVTPCPPARKLTLETDYLWQRPPTPDERRRRYLHAFDKRGQYLAVTSSIHLGRGEAVHHDGPREFDPKLPGYWRISRDALTWDLPYAPDLFNPTGRGDRGNVWLTTPTLSYGQSLGYAIEPLEAYTYPDHARLLEPWNIRLREARKLLMASRDENAPAVLEALKRTYTAGIGRLGSPKAKGSPRYRPDHRHMIQATARVNLTRTIVAVGERTGAYPLAAVVDCLLYASDNPDPAAAAEQLGLRMGTGLGQFKHEGSAHLADVADLLQAGRRPTGRDGIMYALTPPEEWKP